jgi:hypothetical protein
MTSFNIEEEYKQRLVNEFPQHEFSFMSSYQQLVTNIASAEAATNADVPGL